MTSRALAALAKATKLAPAALDKAIRANLDAIVALLTGADPANPAAVALTAMLKAGGHKPGSKVWKAAMAAGGGTRALSRAAPASATRAAVVDLLTAGGHKPDSLVWRRAMSSLTGR